MSSQRVHEIAKSAGVTNAEVLRELTAMGSPAKSASSSVPAEIAAVLADRLDQAAALSTAGLGTESAPDLAALVLRAFEAASATKPNDWRTMTLPVLKNRLLQLTERRFSLHTYGYRTIAELAASLPQLLDVDMEASPATVTLRPDAAVAVLPIPVARTAMRIRRDLWDGVMDFSAGHRWVWSGTAAIPEGDGPAGALALPTATPDELATWRAEFAARHTGADGGDLATWVTSHGATRQLPPALRPLWNAELKARVMARLEAWSGANGIPLPEDALGADRSRGIPAARSARAGSLRSFVAGVVAIMTDEELATLVLPAAAAHRYGERRA